MKTRDENGKKRELFLIIKMFSSSCVIPFENVILFDCRVRRYFMKT